MSSFTTINCFLQYPSTAEALQKIYTQSQWCTGLLNIVVYALLYITVFVLATIKTFLPFACL